MINSQLKWLLPFALILVFLFIDISTVKAQSHGAIMRQQRWDQSQESSAAQGARMRAEAAALRSWEAERDKAIEDNQLILNGMQPIRKDSNQPLSNDKQEAIKDRLKKLNLN